MSFVVERDRAPMDMRRMAEDIGFKPRFGPREAYFDYIDWIENHTDFIGGATQ